MILAVLVWLAWAVIALTVANIAFKLLLHLTSRRRVRGSPSEGSRVAVVGGGIAGCGAAWSLAQNGYNVTLYESRAELGGNAKTTTWPSTPEVTTGLSVLAWPVAYFHNYKQLLQNLSVDTEMVKLPFYVRDETSGKEYAHGKETSYLNSCLADRVRWKRLVEVVRFVSKMTAFTFSPTLYSMSIVNPFNFIPLRWAVRLFGISDEFWQLVVVPIYSSSLLTVDIDGLPAVVVPVIHDLIPLLGTPEMETWSRNSKEVFDKLSAGINVRTSSNVTGLRFNVDGHNVVVDTESGDDDGYDNVVLACNAEAALRMLPDPSFLEKTLLGGVSFTDEEDMSFREGIIHSDSSVIPADIREEVLDRCANYVEIQHPSSGISYENSFVVSSWVPAAQKLHHKPPMIITYNASPSKTIDKSKIRGTVSNIRAHPTFTTKSLMITLGLRAIQGNNNVYYCSSYTTPGNGHDLSLLSGFIVAHTLGAPYPFKGNKLAEADFYRLKQLMGL